MMPVRTADPWGAPRCRAPSATTGVEARARPQGPSQRLVEGDHALDSQRRASGNSVTAAQVPSVANSHVTPRTSRSIRRSHPDAALYWLARMEASGEDAVFVARRLVSPLPKT